MATTLTLNVNGVNRTATVSDSGMPLLWVLRDILGLTGTKYGCGIEVCGACTVLVNGQAEKSCDFDVGSAVGKKIVTVEGLAVLDRQSGAAVRLLPAGDADDHGGRHEGRPPRQRNRLGNVQHLRLRHLSAHQQGDPEPLIASPPASSKGVFHEHLR
jgi:hypothetical protein